MQTTLSSFQKIINEKQKEKNKINKKFNHFDIQIKLLEDFIKITLHNFYTKKNYEGIYKLEDFSSGVKKNFDTLEDIYTYLQIVYSQRTSQKIYIDQNNNFTFQYEEYSNKLKKNQIKEEKLKTKASKQKGIIEQQLAIQIDQLKKENFKLNKQLVAITEKLSNRIESIQKVLHMEAYIKQQNQMKIQKQISENLLKMEVPQKKYIIIDIINQEMLDEFQQQVKGDLLNFKLTKKCMIFSQFQVYIKKQDIPEEIALLYSSPTHLYKEAHHFLKQDNSKQDGIKVCIDKNFDLTYQNSIRRAGQILLIRGVFKTQKKNVGRLEQISRKIILNYKKLKQEIFNIEGVLLKKLTDLKQIQYQRKQDQAQLSNIFTFYVQRLQFDKITQVLNDQFTIAKSIVKNFIHLK